jgi:hypothetical protein
MSPKHPFLPAVAAAGILSITLACAIATPVDTGATATVQAGQTLQHQLLDQQIQQKQTLQHEQLRQTDEALQATAASLSATQTVLALPTATATSTPGPVVIHDDFSRDTGRWAACDVCAIRDGALTMGPFPSTDSDRAYFTLCQDCGTVGHFVMSVDAWYVEGASDRGYGLIYHENNGEFFDLEITTWQLFGVWFYSPTQASPTGGPWSSSMGFQPSKYLHPGRLVNHIELRVEAYDNPYQKSLCSDQMTITINRGVETHYYPLCKTGNVGLIVGLHSLGVAFDNFYFEALP